MSNIRVLVLRAAGVNCETETAFAWESAGALPDVQHINVLRAEPRRLLDYQILTVPGGFSYGDDIAAGKILANQMMLFLGDALREFCDRDRLVLGICNGFQVLCKAGLLPGPGRLPPVTVTENLSRKYEDRWVHLDAGPTRCRFLEPGRRYHLPVAHGEGRVAVREPADIDTLKSSGCAALRYASADGEAVEYPANPNGSMGDVAGLCDPTGRIFGLMPHPERFIHITQHPEWTGGGVTEADGLRLFKTAVASMIS
jgi:phosphoribosylformylglycinamidine synthase